MIRKLLQGIPKKLLICNAIFTIIWGLMNSYMTVALAKVTAVSVEQKTFVGAALFFIGYILAWEVAEFVCDMCDGTQDAYVRNESYRYYYKKIYETKPSVLQKENTGYVAGILTQLIERKAKMMQSILLASISIIYIGYLIVYIGKYSSWFSLIVLGLTIVGVLIRLACSKTIAPGLKTMTTARGELNKIFMDGIHNISTVQRYRGIDFLMKKTDGYCKENLRATKQFFFGNEVGFTAYKTVNYLLCPICMFVALALYTKNPDFPMVEFMAYLAVVTVQLVHNVKNIATFINDFNIFATSQREMDKMVAEWSDSYTSTSIGNEFETISLKDVSYQYTTAEGATTIRIPHFSMKKGERICITGESGQGKTTMLKLLSGMIETEGKLFVDGKETKKNIDAVFIAQDTEMLDMTLRENLTFGKEDISDEELVSMMEEVGMGDWLEKQKDGLDTMLGERGVFVSTGQRQRLNLLRGLLMEKEIYLLDEPTSNVDDETEEKMIALINRRLKEKTIIVVTHKPKICGICDTQYQFRDNRICRVC